MAKRVFDNPTLRAWWLVHIEAWQKSGDTLTKYCRVHRINIERFRRWRREITDWEAQKSERSARRKKHWKPLSSDKRRRATQAYWAMHVEAWIWSGMHLRDYSAALRVSSHSLSRWRKIFESEEITIDWRAMLHPAARAAISTKIEPSAKEKAEAARLTEAIEAEAPPPRRAVRRRWTTEEKIAILLQAERHGSTISSVGHTRRKFYDVEQQTGSPIAAEALRRIATLYEVEKKARGQSPAHRMAWRRSLSRPHLAAMKGWLEAQLALVPARSTLADAIRYALGRWTGLTRFIDDGRVELDTNPVERAIRPVALGRKNHLFAGSDGGGHRWAVVCSMIETAKLNGVEP